MNLPAAKTEAVFCADIGTSSLKAALIGTDGKLLAFSRNVYAGPAPYCWRAAFLEALESIASQCPVRAAVLVISGSGPTLIPVPEDGKSAAPLYWFSAPENVPGGPVSGPPPIFEPASGQVPGPLPSLFLPRVLAYKNRDPASFKKTKLFLSSQEWLSFSLGAAPVTSLPQEAYKPFYWDGEQCEKAGIDMGLFPPFVPMGSVIGRIRGSVEGSDGAEIRIPETVLPEGTPILAGGPDFIMALLGSAAIEPGTICDRAGSSEGINLCVDEAACKRIKGASAAAGIRLLPHARKGLFNAGLIIGESGSLFEAYRRDSGQAAKPYETLMEEISADKAHPARAVLDRIALQVKAALEKLRAAGIAPDPVEMVVSGGQAKSPLWNAVKAKKTGAVLLVPEIPDGELTGGAILGAMYLESAGDRPNAAAGPSGEFPDPGRIGKYVRRMVRIQERYEP
jgi:xylulokinase